jgi:transposase
VDPNPDPRDARIAQLEQLLRAALETIVVLQARVAELEAKLGENSKNSSKPPSSDGPGVDRPGAKPKGRKRGGQPGHDGHARTLLLPDRVVDHKPTRCRGCDARLVGDDVEPKRWQVLELPEIKPDVTEHRAHALCCGACGVTTTATFPDQVVMHGFGPRMSGAVAYLSGRCRLSKRQISELLADLFGTPMSLGAVCAVEKDVSHALAVPVEEARAAVREQPVAHLDETGWREDKQRAWLWVAVTAVATVFVIARSRGGKVAREILGEQFAGIAVSDRWSGYNWVDTARRQLCWAHLLRDLMGMTERDGVGARIAAEILIEVDKMLDWWREVRDGTLARAAYQSQMQPIRERVRGLLSEASTSAAKKTAGMCREILTLEPALWTFIDIEGIEPTNNAAERAIRPAVLWRKGSFGSDSEVGSRFVERILTTVATLRQQRRSVIEYLADACAAVRAGQAVPSLLADGAR